MIIGRHRSTIRTCTCTIYKIYTPSYIQHIYIVCVYVCAYIMLYTNAKLRRKLIVYVKSLFSTASRLPLQSDFVAIYGRWEQCQWKPNYTSLKISRVFNLLAVGTGKMSIKDANFRFFIFCFFFFINFNHRKHWVRTFLHVFGCTLLCTSR